MTEVVFLVEEDVEGGYHARALGPSIHIEGHTLEQIREAARDAVRCHFEDAEMPAVIRLHIVREEILAA